MPKDTKSSGYNKAPACESRGFGHKKEGENFDTPSCAIFIFNKAYTVNISYSYNIHKTYPARHRYS